MKTALTTLMLSSMLLVGFQSSLTADPPPYTPFIVSPDHPNTWVVGASNIHKDLRWDSDRKTLVADVKYSTIDWADSMHPAKEEDYSLSFPNVKLNPATGAITTEGVKLGSLQNGLFGPTVRLRKGVELDIHRHHGRIFAKIVPLPNRDGV